MALVSFFFLTLSVKINVLPHLAYYFESNKITSEICVFSHCDK